MPPIIDATRPAVPQPEPASALATALAAPSAGSFPHEWLPCVGLKPPKAAIRYYCRACHLRATEREMVTGRVPRWCALHVTESVTPSSRFNLYDPEER